MNDSPGKGFRSGYVSITGRPNVGKSTLLNTILGEKVAIVTSRPQTTRNRIVGVKTTPGAQIIFIDTPGIHRPRERLGEFMVREATSALKDVDIVLLMAEPRMPGDTEIEVMGMLSRMKESSGHEGGNGRERPVLLLLNKIDTVRKSELLPIIERYSSLYPFDEIIPVSALKGDGIERVVDGIIKRLPEGPKYYPDDIFTDQVERFMAAEIIREKTMNHTQEEIPYSVAVDVIKWEDKEDIVLISADIYVEKESQKGIIIGKKGMLLKMIGSEAREELERLLNTRVFLELWVKVKEKWRDRLSALRELGYK